MADVAGVPMANEHGQVTPGRIERRGEKPAVQPYAITGLEMQLFKRTSQPRRAGDQRAIGVINLAMFEPAKHVTILQCLSRKVLLSAQQLNQTLSRNEPYEPSRPFKA